MPTGLMNGDAEDNRLLDELGMLGAGVCRDEHLANPGAAARRLDEGLANGLHAFGKERPIVLAKRPLLETLRRSNTRRPDIGQLAERSGHLAWHPVTHPRDSC